MDARRLERAPVRIARSRLAAPVVSYDAAAREWVLEEPYRYGDGDTRLEVPAGFRFDLASVPRLFWPIVAPFELSIVAPLLHDFLYRHVGALPPRSWTRAEADRLFLRAMEAEGVPAWRRWLAYLGTRAFGRRRWGYSLGP